MDGAVVALAILNIKARWLECFSAFQGGFAQAISIIAQPTLHTSQLLPYCWPLSTWNKAVNLEMWLCDLLKRDLFLYVWVQSKQWYKQQLHELLEISLTSLISTWHRDKYHRIPKQPPPPKLCGKGTSHHYTEHEELWAQERPHSQVHTVLRHRQTRPALTYLPSGRKGNFCILLPHVVLFYYKTTITN